MDKISFQGKTNLIISNLEFARAANKTDVTRYHGPLTTRSSNLGSSRTLNYDVTGGDLFVVVRNARTGFVEMLKPFENIKIGDKLEKIAKKVEELKDSTNEKLTAWIIGGKPNDNKTIGSVNALGEILCDRPDIDTSILAGAKKMPGQNMLLEGHVGSMNVIFPQKNNIQSIDDLANNFDIFELNNVEPKIEK
jgi:hypothetical protein